jgi:hypothetical protein
MMRRFGIRVVAATAVAVAIAIGALAGCTAAPPPTRTTPNQVERDAVQAAVGPGGVSPGDASIPWRQLWTVAQFPQQMKSCAGEASVGQLAVTIGPLPLRRLEYHIIGSGSQPNEAEAGRIIDACRAQTPVDDRMLRLPASDAPALYGYDLTVLRPCLLSHGFDVSLPPSRQRFEQLLHAQQPWSPYDRVVVPSRVAWYALSDACPAIPKDLAVVIPAR